MPTKQFPTDILSQAIDTQEALVHIDNDLSFGNVNVATLATDIAQIRSFDHTQSNLETQLTDIRAMREAVCQSAWDKVKRARAEIKANFGDDSRQYEMIGGTRVSDRKSTRRTQATIL